MGPVNVLLLIAEFLQQDKLDEARRLLEVLGSACRSAAT